MQTAGLRRCASEVARKTGLLPCYRALEGRAVRVVRSCARGLKRLHGQPASEGSLRVHAMNAEGLPTWFGYFDKTPFSRDNTKVLAMAMTSAEDWSGKAARMPVRLGVFEWAETLAGKSFFRQFAETGTWSWQQGCMLQWFPDDPDRLVLYNRLVEGRYGSVVQDVFSRRVEMSYSMPVYAIDPFGRQGVTLDFSRLERLRPGYGYGNLPDATQAEPCPDHDGVWGVDLRTGRCEMLLSLREISDLRPLPSMADAQHYVNHFLYAPDGECFVFLHLWTSQGRRRNRLMLYDLADGSLHVLDDEATVSHFNWLGGDRLMCFRSPHGGRPGYYLYGLGPGHAVDCAPMPSLASLTDGHPSLSPSGEMLVTDTYPDRGGEQALHVYSMRESSLREIGRFFSPFRYRGFLRCDLHPRWDRTGRLICFDSACRGRRSLFVAEADVPCGGSAGASVHPQAGFVELRRL